MTIFNNMLFWVCVVLCVISVYKMYLSGRMEGFHARELRIHDPIYRLLLVLALLIAVFIRVYRFGSVPGGFNVDGAMGAVDAKALADYGTDRFGMRLPVHLTAWGYGQMSALLSYLTAPFIKLFGLSAVTARLPLLLVSLAGLVCLYLLVKDVFGRNVGLIVLWFAAINPWHVLQSRWAIDCNLYPHLVVAGLFCLHRAVIGRRRLWLTMSMVLFGLCMYSYGISLYTLPLLLLAACIYLLATKKLRISDAVLAAGVYLLVAWPFFAVMAINFFGWDTVETPLFTLPFFPDSIRSNDILFFSENVFSQLVANFKSLVKVTALQTKDLPWNDVQNFGTMYLFSMPFAAAGLCGLLFEFRKKAGAVLVLFFLGMGIWCGLATNGVNVNRLNIIYYPIMILAGIGIWEVIRWIKLPRLEYGIAAAYALAFVLFARTYFTGYAEEMSTVFYEDFGNAVSSLKDSDAEKIYITLGNRQTPAIAEIYTLFWQQVDAEYFQGKTSLGRLPYEERYTYGRMEGQSIDSAEDAAYVVGSDELDFFDEELYEFRQYGAFYTVVRKDAE